MMALISGLLTMARQRSRAAKKDGSILRTYGAGKDPFGIAFDGVNIWVANSGDNTVSSSLSLL
jgi:DNA-binding beta-propeller fold protein YncE